MIHQSSTIQRSAIISPCRTWRYRLDRIWTGKKPPALFIGLNPSTADELWDDPTIRRCMRFAQCWGYGGLVMVNLFAFRATDPTALKSATDPIGPDNDLHLVECAGWAGIVIAAWGVHGDLGGRAGEVITMLDRENVELHCLGITKEGHPRHPLYLQKACVPIVYERKHDHAHNR